MKLLVRIEARIDNLHAGLVRGATEVEAFGKNVQKTLVTTAKSSRQFQHDLALGMAATGGAIALGFGLATKGAIDFERAMRNVATIATNQKGLSLTQKEFESLGNSIRDLSTQVPQSAKVLAEAMYQVVSTGFQGEEAMQVLKASAVAASAGLTDAGTAASGIVTVLKAYGESGYHAAEVSNVLFEAVNLGAFSFEGLSQNMGQFVALAASMKVPLTDAAAAMATISLAGHDASTSATLLNRVFTAFLNPSDALTQKLGELKLSIADLSQTGGLQKVLNALSDSVHGDAQALQAFFPDVRELNGVLALTANNGKNAADVLGTFHNPLKVATAAQQAFNEQAKSTAFRLQIARNEVTALGLQLGNTLTPIVGDVADFFTNLAASVDLLPAPVKAFVVIATGAVGVTALLGATALFAVPKIAGFQAALAGLGKQGVTTAAELGTTSTAIEVTGDAAAAKALTTGGAEAAGAAGGVGLGLGGLAAIAIPVAATLGVVATVFADMGKKAREATKATNDFYDALQQEAHGVDGATSAAIQNELVTRNMVSTASKYHLSLKDIESGLDGNEAALKRVTAATNARLRALRASAGDKSGTDLALIASGSDEGDYGKLKKFRDALNDLSDSNDKAREKAAAHKRELEKLAAAGNIAAQTELAQINATNGEADAMDAAGSSAEAFAKKLAGLSDTQQSIFHAFQSGAQELPDIFKDTSGGGGGGAAGKSAAQKAQDVAHANLGIEQSTRAVAQATERVRDAQKALDMARDQSAQRQAVQKAERQIAQSYSDSQRAVFALKNAEQALEDQRRNQQSGRSLAEAQIAVQRARAQAQDATKSMQDAQQALTDAQQGGDPAEIAKAQQAVVLAQADLKEATWGAQDAQLALNRAKEKGGSIDQAVATAALDVGDAQRAIASSADGAAAAQQTLADAQEALANNQAVIDAEGALADANLALRGSLLGVVDAHLALTAAQKDDSGSSAASGNAAKVKKSLKEYSDELAKSNTETASWAKDLAAIAGDPNLGGQAVADELAKMGRDGASYVHEMATSTSQDVKDMRDNLRTHAALGSNEFVLALAGGMDKAQQMMGIALATLLASTGTGADQITQILKTLGLTFSDVANTQFRVNTNTSGVGGTTAVRNGPRVGSVNAAGDVKNAHQPEIAAGGAMRLWAEPETKGESYIPHANDWRRPRAVSLWEQTGRILGQFAAGGVNLGSLKPKLSDFDGLQLPLYQGATFNTATTAWQRLGLNLQSRGVTTYAGGGMTSGGAGRGGNGATSIVYGPGAVRVDVKVAADVDRGAVGAIVQGAVDSALGKHTQDLRHLLATR